MASDVRGALSKTDKEFLRGESDVEPQSQHERTMRSRVRKHVIQSIKDFNLIDRELEDRDRQKIFEELPQERDGRNEFEQGATDVIRFIWRGLRERGVDAEEFFEHALGGSESSHHTYTYGSHPGDVDVDIEVEVKKAPDGEGILDRLKDNNPVTFEDLRKMKRDVFDRLDIDQVTISRPSSSPRHHLRKQDIEDLARGILSRKNIYPDYIEVVEEDE